MERLNIQQAICQAVQTIVDSKIAKTKFNTTRIGIITEQTDLDKGIYKVRQGDRQIYANSLNSNITYDLDTQVYFLNINNQSEKFYILGSVSGDWEDGGRIVELVNQALKLANEANETAAAAVVAAQQAGNMANNATQAAESAGQAAAQASAAASQVSAAVESITQVSDVIDTVVEQSLLNDTIYYLATNKSENVKVSDSGWTIKPQQITSAKRYLWTYHAYLKGDGTVIKTDPVISGVFGQIGVTVIKTEEYYALSENNTLPASSEFSKSVPTPSISLPYLWNFERLYYSDDTIEDSDPHLLLVYDGSTEGRGIASITEYYAVSGSTTPPDDSAFSPVTEEHPNPPVMTVSNRYLWNYEYITYTDGQNPTKTEKRIIGVYGDTGQAGTSITIGNIWYGSSTAASTTPIDWSTTVPSSVETGKWLWVKTVYSDGSEAITKNFVGKDGEDGNSVYIQQTYKEDNITTVIFVDNNGTQAELNIVDGTDGNDGIDGANGLNIHIAWANSANGMDPDFSTSESTGRSYIGVYSSTATADSQNPADYSWSKIKGEQGPAGQSVQTVIEYYLATSVDNVQYLPPTTSIPPWSTEASTQIISKDTPYLWNYQTTIGSAGTRLGTTQPTLIGNFSQSGEDGVGIEKIEEWYLACSSAEGVEHSTLGWTTAVQMTSTANRYLWNYEVITWTSGSPTSTAPAVIGTHGETGPKGEDGKDGISITGVTNYYLATSVTSGVTTARSSWNWQDSIQPIDATTPYLWNYQQTIGLDNGSTSVISITQPVIIARYSENGQPGQGISDINQWYYISGSSSVNSVPPTSERKPSYVNGWSDTPIVPTSELRYLWNFEEIFWVNPTTVTTTDPAVIGIHGQKGLDGVSPQVVQGVGSITIIDANGSSATISDGQPGESISRVVERYLATSASSEISTTSSGWTTAVSEINLNATNCYLWNYQTTIGSSGSELSVTTPIIIGHYGVDGQPGTPGTPGAPGKGIQSITEYYLACSTSNVSQLPTTGVCPPWSTSIQSQTMDRDHIYLWNNQKITWTDGDQTATQPGIIGMFTEGTSEVHQKYLITSADSGVTTADGVYGNWSTSIQNPTSSAPYLWNYQQVIGTGGSTLSTTNPVIIGNYAKDGDPGRGILGSTEYYQVTTGVSTESLVSSKWGLIPPPTSPDARYLWNYEEIEWINPTTVTKTNPAIIGTHGLTGEATLAINEYYQINNNSTAVPSVTPISNWSTAVISPNSSSPYLWNFEQTIGTLGHSLGKTTPVIIARYTENGQPGAPGRGVSGIENWYLASYASSNVTTADGAYGTWSTQIAYTNASSPYLWNYQKIFWTNPSSTEGTTPAVIGVHGMPGKGVSSIQTQYILSNSTSVTPSSADAGWSINPVTPYGSSLYVWTRDYITFDDSIPTTSVTEGVYNPILTQSWTLASNAASSASSAFASATSAIDIATNVTQHFWFDSTGDDTGAHITQVTQDYWKNTSAIGGNLLANTNGVEIRDGMIPLALLSTAQIQLGIPSSGHMILTNSALDFKNNTTSLALFSTAGARVGDITKNHIIIDDNSMDIADGSNTYASFSTATWIGENFGQRLTLDKYGLSLTLDGANDVLSMKVNDISSDTITETKVGSLILNSYDTEASDTFDLNNIPAENSYLTVTGEYTYTYYDGQHSYTETFSINDLKEDLTNQTKNIWYDNEYNCAILKYDGLKTFEFVIRLGIEEQDQGPPEQVGGNGGESGTPQQVGGSSYTVYPISIVYNIEIEYSTTSLKTDPTFVLGQSDKNRIILKDEQISMLDSAGASVFSIKQGTVPTTKRVSVTFPWRQSKSSYIITEQLVSDSTIFITAQSINNRHLFTFGSTISQTQTYNDIICTYNAIEKTFQLTSTASAPMQLNISNLSYDIIGYGNEITLGSRFEPAGANSIVVGYNCISSGQYSYAEGYRTTASGNYSHTEGVNTLASQSNTHAEGYRTTASGFYSHTEGNKTIANNTGSHAEGAETTASGYFSHAEGAYTITNGTYSHAEGYKTTAIGSRSHVSGYNTIASQDYQTVIGQYNSTADTAAFIIGNGTSAQTSNAFKVDWGGQVKLYLNTTESSIDQRLVQALTDLDWLGVLE